MATKRRKLMADFETTVNPADVRVWAGCAVDIEELEVVHIGTSLGGFMEYLQDKNTVCYFHNLKFDGEFILHWLFTHGYKYSDSRKDKTFQCLITDDGLFYSIEVVFRRFESKKYHKVVFYDSLKKLPFKVAVIAKAFELAMSKGEIDYKADRPIGYELTPEEKDYIIRDCKIVAEALKIQFEQGLKKMTNASDALNGYKEIIGKSTFEKWFPVLPVELDEQLRWAYKGGFVYLNPKHRNRRGLKGITLDVNSLYPSVMYYKVLPYGYPVFFEGRPVRDEKYPLFIVHFKCCFELKPGHLPTLQLKNNRRYVETEYLTTSRVDHGAYEENDPVEMWLTNVDYELLLDHYDITHETYYNGFKFKGAVGMFKDYIDHWMHIKETTTGALRQLAKLMLNSLYGKFATNPVAKKKMPYLDKDNVVRYATQLTKGPWTDKKGVLHDKPPTDKTIYVGARRTEVYRTKLVELRDPVYTAMGAFITAYAREKTIRSAQAVYDRFIYADTDSLHLIGQEPPEGLEIHPTHLGAWKNEGCFEDSKFIRAKTYMETVDGVTKVTCAGMPDNVKEQVTYDNFHPGSTFEGKLMPRRYPGGIILEETTFTIK
jgi:hypothetical protein